MLRSGRAAHGTPRRSRSLALLALVALAAPGAGFGQAGLRYDVDLKGAEGAVILNVEVEERATGAWSPIDPAAVYTVATNSFTALGRDNYLEFAAVREANPVAFEDTYINYFLPLKQYIKRLDGGVLPPVDVAQYTLKSVVD